LIGTRESGRECAFAGAGRPGTRKEFPDRHQRRLVPQRQVGHRQAGQAGRPRRAAGGEEAKCRIRNALPVTDQGSAGGRPRAILRGLLPGF